MKLSLITFQSSRFTFHAEDGTLTAEASDLRDQHLQRIYDDACDVGLAVQSGKSGTVITYYLHKEHTNGDNEITHWEYLPLPEDVRKHSECANTKVLIYND